MITINDMISMALVQNANKEFLYAAIKRQITNCIINEKYKAGVFVAYKVSIEFITSIIKEVIEERWFEKYIADVRPITVSANETTVVFGNGSYVRVTALTEGCRGMKLNDIIYNVLLDARMVDNVLRPMLVPYRENDRGRDYGLKIIGFEL